MQKVYCPYCPATNSAPEGVEMQLHSNAKIYYVCPACGSRSPEGKGPQSASITERWEAEDDARRAALRRHVTPIEPLTWWEAVEGDYFLEIKGEKNVNVALLQGAFSTIGRITPCDNAVYTTHDRDELKLYGMDYGITWRCWSRMPTPAERKRAAWQKDESAADRKPAPVIEIQPKPHEHVAQDAKQAQIEEIDEFPFNEVVARGVLEDDLKIDHEKEWGATYAGTLLVKRKSATVDRLTLLIPEKVLYTVEPKKGERWFISGAVRTYLEFSEGETHKKTKVFVKYMSKAAEDEDLNDVRLVGRVAALPSYKVTLNGQEVCNFMLSIERGFGRRERIPCVAWGGAAKYASMCKVGEALSIVGNVQSSETWVNGNSTTAMVVKCNRITTQGGNGTWETKSFARIAEEK